MIDLETYLQGIADHLMEVYDGLTFEIRSPDEPKDLDDDNLTFIVSADAPVLAWDGHQSICRVRGHIYLIWITDRDTHDNEYDASRLAYAIGSYLQHKYLGGREVATSVEVLPASLSTSGTGEVDIEGPENYGYVISWSDSIVHPQQITYEGNLIGPEPPDDDLGLVTDTRVEPIEATYA